MNIEGTILRDGIVLFKVNNLSILCQVIIVGEDRSDDRIGGCRFKNIERV